MVEVKHIQIKEYPFIGVYLNLPQYPIHFIISTHTILAQDYFSLDFFNKKDKQVAVILCRYTFGFDGLLDSEVLDMNDIAKARGITSGMLAKEAVVLCEENKTKKI